jgi:hypothetical protein
LTMKRSLFSSQEVFAASIASCHFNQLMQFVTECCFILRH